jgi:hypothetical protein
VGWFAVGWLVGIGDWGLHSMFAHVTESSEIELSGISGEFKRTSISSLPSPLSHNEEHPIPLLAACADITAHSRHSVTRHGHTHRKAGRHKSGS